MFFTIQRKNSNGDNEDVVLEFSESLATAERIQKRFANKPFLQVARGIQNMHIDELIGYLDCGLKPNQMTGAEFKTLIMEHVGLSELIDGVSALTLGIQYPGLSEEEIEKKVRTQQEKAKRMEIGYQNSSNEEPLSD